MQQVRRFKINGKENMETYTFRVLDTLLVEKKIWAVIRDLSCNWCQTTFTSEEESQKGSSRLSGENMGLLLYLLPTTYWRL